MLNGTPLGGFSSPSEMLCAYLKGDLSGDLLSESGGGISPDGAPSAILAAFSGGADSSLMLAMLSQWCSEKGVKLYAAHVNHGIRGEEAIRDREFCRTVCEKMGIEAFILDADVPKIARETGKSLESAARDVRYDFFADIMAKNRIPVLATAHNADDNLETVIFRLARGTALKGLCGIPPVREVSGGYVIRPILSLTKKEVLDICHEKGIEYVYDSTNSDDSYARNSIRASVIPILKSLNPEASELSVRSCAVLRSDCEYLDSLARKYISEKDCNLAAKLAELEEPIFNRVMLLLSADISDSMPEYTHIRALKELVKKGREHSSLSLPGRKRAVIERGRLLFCEDERDGGKSPDIPEERLLFMGENLFGEYVLTVERCDSTDSSHSTPQIQKNEENIYKLFTQVSLQSDKIIGKLRVRCRVSGDRIRNGGMSKDVRKLFSEKRIPIEKRASYPLICDESGVLYIPNIAVRDGVKIKNKEKENSPLGVMITVKGGLH